MRGHAHCRPGSPGLGHPPNTADDSGFASPTGPAGLLAPEARERLRQLVTSTRLANLALLCRFHHLTVIHHWNWTLTCHPDGTTAVSPDGRTLHSHGPPCCAA